MITKQQFEFIIFNYKMSLTIISSDNPANMKPIMIPRFSHGSSNAINFTKKTNKSFQQLCPPKMTSKFLKGQLCKDNLRYSPPIYQCKQNLQTIILEQKKLEMSERIFSAHTKRPVSSYQHTFLFSSTEVPTQKDPYIQNNAIKLQSRRTNMDSVCSKMAQSIILSSDTLDSQTEMSAPLSVDNFQKLRFLGQGKFGQVHLVKHKQTGFICALKIIDKNVVRQQKVESQIAKQLRIQNQLKSLNIISFYGFFDDDKYFYILLQYATEGSVFSKLKGRSRLQQSQIQPIAKGLCDGLRFMHRMGFIHRDIKPENIVLQFGVPKICDFGWATDCDDTHLCKSYCGTPLYISPEMIRKQFYGASVDIWAAGLVIYELLVGRVPFSIWSENDMEQIIRKSIQFPQYVDRSQNCQSFIRKCLQKQTFNRMQISEALRHPFLNENGVQNIEYEFFQMANKLFNTDKNY